MEKSTLALRYLKKGNIVIILIKFIKSNLSKGVV